MNTRRFMRSLALFALLAPSMISACATEGAAVVENEAPRAPALETDAWAIGDVEGSLPNTDALAFALADSVNRASGAPIVTKTQVTAEINSCSSNPCPTIIRDAFANAKLVVSGTVAQTGQGFLATGTVRTGARVVTRASASGSSAEAAVRRVGIKLGEATRMAVINGEIQ